MPAAIDIIGCRFGRLIVVQELETYVSPGGKKMRRFEALCDCGGSVDALGAHIRYRKIRSCGCLRNETTAARRTKHGHLREYKITPEYTAWRNMINRCEYEKGARYQDYGGRGIKVCAAWRNRTTGFANFLDDMDLRPSHEHSLDRIDNYGHYEPGNCRWATDAEQRANKRPRRSTGSGGKS